MNKTKQKLRNEQRKLARLKKENKKLKARNKKLRQTNISLKKNNNLLRRKIRIKQGTIKRLRKSPTTKEEKEEKKEENKYFRYSIAFYNANYEKTFRAEVYTTSEQNATNIQNQLRIFINQRIGLMNKGMQKMFAQSSFLGLESDQVGNNDVGQSELNKMHFWID